MTRLSLDRFDQFTIRVDQPVDSGGSKFAPEVFSPTLEALPDAFLDFCIDLDSRNHVSGRTLASLQEPSAFEYRRHRLFDSHHPRCRLLGRGKVVQVTPLPPRSQRLEA